LFSVQKVILLTPGNNKNRAADINNQSHNQSDFKNFIIKFLIKVTSPRKH